MTELTEAGEDTAAGHVGGPDGAAVFPPVGLPRPTPDDEVARLLESPGFGRVMTDHMISAAYSVEEGWHDARLTAYQPLSLQPSSLVLHYAQSIFEGLKAYAQPDGGVALFRPADNARRFNASARRMAMPELPEEWFVEGLETLVRADRRFVPREQDQSLYLRPFMFADEPMLGVRPSASYRFLVIASPSESFFGASTGTVTVWLSHEYVRAAPGGTGEAKCAGNYAASLLAQQQAAEKGCDQVVWLDAVERRFVEEMGGMNLCFVMQGEQGGATRLVTPELTGTLLAGVTRDSLLTLGRDFGLDVAEERIDIEQWEKGCRDGTITEVFACGTAAVVTPVGEVRHAGGEWTVGDGRPGPVTMQLRNALLDLQHGKSPDTHGWRLRVD
jgi:branched-chain amino acid aminotransferase